MGRTNFEHWTPATWRESAETVDHMLTFGWDVVAYCPACKLAMRVNLGHLKILCGDGFSLWNRKALCRRLRCTGVVRFYGKPPQDADYIRLIAERPGHGGVPPKASELKEGEPIPNYGAALKKRF